MQTIKSNIILFLIIIAMFCLGLNGCKGTHVISETEALPGNALKVPLGGNSWRDGEGSGQITDEGIKEWSGQDVSFTAYVRINRPGSLRVWLDAVVPSGQSVLRVLINDQDQKISLSAGEDQPVYAGEWQVKDTGYVAIKIEGISKEGEVFADIQNLQVSGTAVDNQTAFVKNNNGRFFYWGRRGPSVHLNYKVPEGVKIEWFYNEVTVPKGEDVLGSYFMADGFSGGYFGMQVNSPTVRHILFSVWSPYKTNDPNEIPEGQRIQLLKKGEKVHAGKFGNEGSGGQSYLNYPWKAGNTYKFLLHGVPDGPGHTIYTAYFYAPEEGRWLLIASFRRPKSSTYLKGLYSFLENFSPRQGDIERHVLFGNQWIRTANGLWIELNKSKFTVDNTGRKGYRMDYAGGVKGRWFYLKNCGFFDHYTPVDSWFERAKTGNQPEVNFNQLP